MNLIPILISKGTNKTLNTISKDKDIPKDTIIAVFVDYYNNNSEYLNDNYSYDEEEY